MKLKPLTLAIILTATFSTCTQADTLNFDFSFTSDLSGVGNIPGTVTGEIIGLQNNATSAPSEIIITSDPAAFSSAGFTTPIAFPINTALDHRGGFTVSNGILESGNFEIDTFYQGSNGSSSVDSNITLNGPQNFLREGPPLITGNNGGFAGVTFTPVAAPEPGAGVLALICVVAFITLRSISKSRQAV